MKNDLIKSLTNGDFHTAGSLIGSELPKKRLWLLSDIKVELEKIGMRDVLTNIPPYAQGYMDAMNDIIESFEQVVRKEVMDMIDDPNNPTSDDLEDVA